MRQFGSKLGLSFMGMLVGLCYCYAANQSVAIAPPDKVAAEQEKQGQTKPSGQTTAEQKPEQQPVSKAPSEPANVVARIGDYVITQDQLRQRFLTDLRPYDYEQFNLQTPTPDVKTVLLKMIAEKAMLMEARKQNLIEDPNIHKPVKEFVDRKLVNLLLQKHLQTNLAITEAEIQQKLKTDPKLNEAQAKLTIEKEKAGKILDKYYADICAKFHLQKISDNFTKAAQIHERLLLHPKAPRNVEFIRNSQIENELTPEEKNIVLATYDNGKLTLKDWFDTLCDIVPPRRPTDLNTPAGVGRLLDIALRMPLLVCEAKSLGLDKDKDLIAQTKEREDMYLFNKIIADKAKEINEPNAQQIIDYYNKNKDVFVTDRTLKIDQIWFPDSNTAQKAKSELQAGKDFETVRQLYSLEKKGEPFNTSPGSESLFFNDLNKAEPNEIVGPIKGFYGEGLKWRIVKILEKKPGTIGEYSDDMRDRIKRKMVSERGNALLENYGKELLEKYKYEIYADRIKDIDPLNIP